MESSSTPGPTNQASMETNETVAEMERRIDAEIEAACPDASEHTTILSLCAPEIMNLTLARPPTPAPPSLPPKENHRAEISAKTKPVPRMSVKTTYSGAASKPKDRVDDILHVYASKNKKTPISQCEWDYIMEILIDLHTSHVLSGQINPSEVRVAHTGFDGKHRCGFIACRNEKSAAWHKKAIDTVKGSDGLTFRAWAKGDLPQVRLCRIYLPTRFERIPDEKVIPLIKAYNPELKNSDICIKKSESLSQGGRAIFIEIDQDSYTHVRAKQYKLEFVLGDIDCHGVAVTPPPPPPQAKPAQELASDTNQSKTNQRSGVNAILPSNAISDLTKISKRDPRVKTQPPAIQAAGDEDDSDSADSCSTTSSRGSAKYKPPQRKSSPSLARQNTEKDDEPTLSNKDKRGRSGKSIQETAPKNSPQKRGRDPSSNKTNNNKISPGNPSSKRDRKK